MSTKSHDDADRAGLDFAPAPRDHFARAERDRSADMPEGNGRSNFAAFLLGGVVVAGGLLAFLYFDSEPMSGRDVLTTGSVPAIERPAVETAPGGAIDQERSSRRAP